MSGEPLTGSYTVRCSIATPGTSSIRLFEIGSRIVLLTVLASERAPAGSLRTTPLASHLAWKKSDLHLPLTGRPRPRNSSPPARDPASLPAQRNNNHRHNRLALPLGTTAANVTRLMSVALLVGYRAPPRAARSVFFPSAWRVGFSAFRGESDSRTVVRFLRWAELPEIAERPVGASTRRQAVTRLRSVWLSSQTDAAYR